MRAQDLTASNLRPIDVGTANTISLRRDNSQQIGQQPGGQQPPVPQQQPTNQPGVPPGQSNPPPPNTSAAPPQGTAATTQPSTASAPAGSPIVSFDPPMLDQAVGSTFTVNVNLAGGQNVFSVPLQILYNPRVLQLVNVSNGTLLSQDGQTVALVNRDDSMAGILQVTASRPPGSRGIYRRWLGLHSDLPGQSSRTVDLEHQPRRGEERRHAEYARQWLTGHRDCSLEHVV